MIAPAYEPRSGEDIHGDDLLGEWEQRGDIYSVDAYNRRMIPVLESYVNVTYPRESREGHLEYLLERPFLCRTVIENYLRSDGEKWRTLVNCLALPKPRVRIIYIIGEPGAGKSLIALDIARAIRERSGRPIVEVGYAGTRPDFVEPIAKFNHAPHGAVVIDNEAAVNQNARNTATRDGKHLGPALATIRQNDVIGIWVSQSTAMADPNLLRMAQMIIFKPTGMTAGDMERPGLRKKLAYWRELLPRDNRQTFILSKHVPPMTFTRPLPEWYTDDVSTSYRRIEKFSAALALAVQMRGHQKTWNTIATEMAMRTRFDDAPATWKRRVLKANDGIDPMTGERPRASKNEASAASAKA